MKIWLLKETTSQGKLSTTNCPHSLHQKCVKTQTPTPPQQKRNFSISDPLFFGISFPTRAASRVLFSLPVKTPRICKEKITIIWFSPPTGTLTKQQRNTGVLVLFKPSWVRNAEILSLSFCWNCHGVGNFARKQKPLRFSVGENRSEMKKGRFLGHSDCRLSMLPLCRRKFVEIFVEWAAMEFRPGWNELRIAHSRGKEQRELDEAFNSHSDVKNSLRIPGWDRLRVDMSNIGSNIFHSEKISVSLMDAMSWFDSWCFPCSQYPGDSSGITQREKENSKIGNAHGILRGTAHFHNPP